MSKQGTVPSSIDQQIAQKMQEFARLQAELEALRYQAAEAEVAPLTEGIDRLNLDLAPNPSAVEGVRSSATIEVQKTLPLAAPRSAEIKEIKEKEKKKEKYVLTSKIIVEGMPNPEVIMAHFENKKGGELKYKSQLNRKTEAFEILGIERSGILPDENDEKLRAALALADIGAAEVVAANGQIIVRLNPNPPKPKEEVKEPASGIAVSPVSGGLKEEKDHASSEQQIAQLQTQLQQAQRQIAAEKERRERAEKELEERDEHTLGTLSSMSFREPENLGAEYEEERIYARGIVLPKALQAQAQADAAWTRLQTLIQAEWNVIQAQRDRYDVADAEAKALALSTAEASMVVADPDLASSFTSSRYMNPNDYAAELNRLIPMAERIISDIQQAQSAMLSGMGGEAQLGHNPDPDEFFRYEARVKAQIEANLALDQAQAAWDRVKQLSEAEAKVYEARINHEGRRHLFRQDEFQRAQAQLQEIRASVLANPSKEEERKERRERRRRRAEKRERDEKPEQVKAERRWSVKIPDTKSEKFQAQSIQPSSVVKAEAGGIKDKPDPMELDDVSKAPKQSAQDAQPPSSAPSLIPSDEEGDYLFVDFEVPTQEARNAIRELEGSIRELGDFELKQDVIIFSNNIQEAKRQRERLALELKERNLVEIKTIGWQLLSMIDPETRAELGLDAKKKVRWVVEDKCKYEMDGVAVPRQTLLTYYHQARGIADPYPGMTPEQRKEEQERELKRLGLGKNGEIPKATWAKRKLAKKLEHLGFLEEVIVKKPGDLGLLEEIRAQRSVDEDTGKVTRKMRWNLRPRDEWGL
ncbi:MAG: hypothetical protein ACHQUC_07105 [Chlamydiales bacterium]